MSIWWMRWKKVEIKEDISFLLRNKESKPSQNWLKLKNKNNRTRLLTSSKTNRSKSSCRKKSFTIELKINFKNNRWVNYKKKNKFLLRLGNSTNLSERKTLMNSTNQHLKDTVKFKARNNLITSTTSLLMSLLSIKNKLKRLRKRKIFQDLRLMPTFSYFETEWIIPKKSESRKSRSVMQKKKNFNNRREDTSILPNQQKMALSLWREKVQVLSIPHN